MRPVGLIRSPMMQNGRSKPITTSLLAELTTVSVIRWILGFGFEAAVLHEGAQALGRIVGLEPGRGGSASASRSSPQPPAATRRHSAEIGIGVAQAGAHRGAVDRLLKALGQRPLGAAPAGLDDHLRGDVAPGDDDQLGHRRGQPARRRKSASPP